MTSERRPAATDAPLLITAVVLVLAGLYLTRSVLEPVAFSFFVIAMAAPLQALLMRRIGGGLALVITVVVTLAVILLLALLIVWSFGDIGYWVVANLDRFGSAYAGGNRWLEGRGIFAGGLLADRFDIGWVTAPLRAIAASTRSIAGFVTLAFIFIVLGLKESTGLPAKLRRLQGPVPRWDPVATGLDIARLLRRYMAVRTVAGVLTGAATAALAWAFGVERPLAWGVMTFAFNFLPFIGPLIVAILMTLFAAAQFGNWQTPLLVLVTTTAGQFVIGSYLEPILAGAALSMSPYIVLFATFFWGLLWGIPGAFLSVPIFVVLMKVCAQFPASRWVAVLLAGDAEPPPAP